MDQEPASSEKTVALVLNVHRDPGAGMLESMYEWSFVAELTEDGILHQQQAQMPASVGRRKRIRQDYRADLLINGKVIVELKGLP